MGREAAAEVIRAGPQGPQSRERLLTVAEFVWDRVRYASAHAGIRGTYRLKNRKKCTVQDDGTALPTAPASPPFASGCHSAVARSPSAAPAGVAKKQKR